MKNTKTIKTVLFASLIVAMIIPIAMIHADESASTTDIPNSKDEIFKTMEKRLPGFGGVYLDENGVMNVYVTNPSKIKSIDKSMFEDKFDSDLLKNGFKIKQGKQTWTKLSSWQHDAEKLLDDKSLGINTVGIDDKNQALYIGFDKLDDKNSGIVKDFLAKHNIPLDTIMLEETGVIIPVSHGPTLSPLAGGAKLDPTGYAYPCTLGFVANKGTTRVAITAAHCEAPPGRDLAGDQQFKHPYGSSTVVGTEIANSNKTPPRYSDTLLFAPSVSTNFGQLYVDGVYKNIVGKKLSQAVGEIVCANGSTSHVKCGDIKLTGATMYDSGISGNLYGQVHVGFSSLGGDSGAAVYKNESSGGVSIAGTLWGTGGSLSYYSPMSGIEFEQGILTVN